MSLEGGGPKGAAVEAQGVSVHYGDLAAVREATLSVGFGECVGLIGANGSGKSTLLKVLSGSLKRFRGRATVGGRDVRSPTARARVGYMPERTDGFGDLTVEALARLSARAHSMGPREARARAKEVLLQLQLEGRARTRLRDLSRGLRQRSFLAQCLVARPEMVLLDEPTSNMDMASREILAAELKRLSQAGRAMLVTSHDWFELAQYATRFLFMETGRLTPIDNPMVRRGYEILEFSDPTPLVSRLRRLGYEPEVNGHVIRVVGVDSAARLLSDLALDPGNPGVVVRPYMEVQPGGRVAR